MDARGGRTNAQDADKPLSAGEIAPGAETVGNDESCCTAPPGVTPARVHEAPVRADGQGEARAAGEGSSQQYPGVDQEQADPADQLTNREHEHEYVVGDLLPPVTGSTRTHVPAKMAHAAARGAVAAPSSRKLQGARRQKARAKDLLSQLFIGHSVLRT